MPFHFSKMGKAGALSTRLVEDLANAPVNDVEAAIKRAVIESVTVALAAKPDAAMRVNISCNGTQFAAQVDPIADFVE